MHNILLAHGWSVEALRVNKSHEIGIVLNNQYAEPLDQQDENINATKLFDSIHNRWFSDAIFKGNLSYAVGYPLGQNKYKVTSGVISGYQDAGVCGISVLN